MMKRMIALLLSVLLLAGLTACGGSQDPAVPNGGGDSQSETKQPDGTQSPSGESGGIGLTRYEDNVLGYTLLCPDLEMNEYLYTNYWVLLEEENINKPLIIFGYSEYQEQNSVTNEEMLQVTDPKELFDYFHEAVRQLVSAKEAISPRKQLTDQKWLDIQVSNLPTAAFRAKAESSEGDKGIVCICVIGEKRPYMFWAMDLSEDQSHLDQAQKVLEDCVKEFKEGA